MSKNREQFTLTFSEKYIPNALLHQGQLRIISKPKAKYQQWWWRGLEFLTFGKRFNAGYEYICEKVENKPTVYGISSLTRDWI